MNLFIYLIEDMHDIYITMDKMSSGPEISIDLNYKQRKKNAIDSIYDVSGFKKKQRNLK